MSPAHHAVNRRWATLVVVVAVLVAGGVAGTRVGHGTPGGPPVSPAALVSAPDAESSAWYCTGQATPAGNTATGVLVLTNTTAHAVSGTIAAMTDTGSTVTTAVAVPAYGEVTPTIPAPESGTWVSDSVVLAGGGVVTSEVLHGATGWGEAPCTSTTSQAWYFPGGVTSGPDALYIGLFNPSSTPDVVDLTFNTPSGVVHPINFQGLVLQPEQTVVEPVSPYVQNQAAVSTSVVTRTGRIVASELQLVTGNGSGLSIVPGAPQPLSHWIIPEALELQGGSSSVDVYNPGSTTEDVTVRARLDSGPLSPFTERILPGDTWTLSTGSQTRIPDGDAYSVDVTATGGAGVVVGRKVLAPTNAQFPQFGLADAIDSLTTSVAAHEWVVPTPGSTATPDIPGVLPAHLGLANAGTSRETYTVEAITASGLRTIASGMLSAPGFVSLGDTILFGAGLDPLLVKASGPLAVSEDVGPSGTLGAVTIQGVALTAAGGR